MQQKKKDLRRDEVDGTRWRSVEEVEEGTPDAVVAQTGKENNNNKKKVTQIFQNYSSGAISTNVKAIYLQPMC
jgi:hypothetical protein